MGEAIRLARLEKRILGEMELVIPLKQRVRANAAENDCDECNDGSDRAYVRGNSDPSPGVAREGWGEGLRLGFDNAQALNLSLT